LYCHSVALSMKWSARRGNFYYIEKMLEVPERTSGVRWIHGRILRENAAC